MGICSNSEYIPNVLKVQRLNCYKDGDMLPYKQIMGNCNLHKCWDLMKNLSDYKQRRQHIDAFNRESKHIKRGLATLPNKQHMNFSAPFLNQGAALVNVYTDGSVLVHSGAVEMGQGVNIKLIQIASETLGIPTNKITIDEVCTQIVPNVTPSGGSITADLFGGAVKNACDQINERLLPLRQKKPSSTWEELVTTAFMERISLSATGFYKVENIWFDSQKMEGGHVFEYFTFGAACSEVEVNVLTGEHRLLRTDIVFDIGKSLNPAIDIGQIEGGFLQGYGYYCLEELLYTPDGKMISSNSNNYRIPTVRDIPPVFNVTILKDQVNTKAVYSSKGIGEPPFLLGASVYLAIKDAMVAARRDLGKSSDFQLDCPTTPARLLKLCQK